MGIYVHEDMNSAAKLTIELNNTKQYNWLSSSDTDKGIFLSLAVNEIFKSDGVADSLGLYHTVEGVDYVNCTIASLGVDIQMIAGWNKYESKKKVEVTENFEVSVTNGYEYVGVGKDELKNTEMNLLLAKIIATGNVHSYKCDDDCGCTEEINYGCSNDASDQDGIDEFLANYKN